jgi:hypothetical protein
VSHSGDGSQNPSTSLASVFRRWVLKANGQSFSHEECWSKTAAGRSVDLLTSIFSASTAMGAVQRVLGGVRQEADETDKKPVRYRFIPINGAIPGQQPPSRESTLPTLDTLGTCFFQPTPTPMPYHPPPPLEFPVDKVPKVDISRGVKPLVGGSPSVGGNEDSNHSRDLNSLTGRTGATAQLTSRGVQPVYGDDQFHGGSRSASLVHPTPLPAGRDLIPQGDLARN